ncbi:SET domain-containing protein, partial [Periconia macrospinosa]
PPAYPPCTTPLDDLRRISIMEMRLETHHRGCYLLLKVTKIEPFSRQFGLKLVAADEAGETVVVQLCQEDEHNAINVASLFVVKEPYLSAQSSDQPVIRVDHLSDNVILDNVSPTFREISESKDLAPGGTAQSCRLKGNESFKEGRFLKAIKYYNEAITHPATKDEINIILQNRALAFLKTKQFDAALIDTGFPDFGSTPSEKAMFRATVALYSLGRFNECQKVALALCKKFPGNIEAQDILKRVRNRCLEQETGTYEFKKMREEANEAVKNEIPPYMDYATYVDLVEVRQTPNKGRGLFTKNAVKAGDLIFVEKAFAYAVVVKDSHEIFQPSIPAAVNIEKDRKFTLNEVELMRIIAQKLHRNPSFIPGFTTLYHAEYEGPGTSEVDSSPVVDKYLIEEIVVFNSFESSYGSGLLDLQNTSARPGVSNGIWLQASYINHSCFSNVQRAFIGDMMIVRATQDIGKGEEILFWYNDPFNTDLQVRRKEFKKLWGFTCDCCICQTTDPSTVALRKDLTKKLLETSLDINTNEENITRRLNSTYTEPASNVPRIEVAYAQFMLVLAYSFRKMPRKVIQVTGQILKALGFTITGTDDATKPFKILKWGLVPDALVLTLIRAHKAFEDLGLPGNAKQAKAYAKLVSKMVFGHDDTFESFYQRKPLPG